MFSILLIAGHGAGDPGAVGNGFQEQERTRALVEQMALHFKNYPVEVTVYPMERNAVKDLRMGTVSVDFKKFNYVCEVHLNASSNRDATGSMIYIDQTETGCSVEEKILEKMYQFGYKKAWDGVVVTQRQYKDGLIVQNAVRRAGVSHALVEVCFITNRDDMIRFNTGLAQTADCMVRGILEGFGILKIEEEEKTEIPEETPPVVIGMGIAKETMNVRSGPGVEFPVIGYAGEGLGVQVIEQLQNGWLKILWPKTEKGYGYTSNANSSYYDVRL